MGGTRKEENAASRERKPTQLCLFKTRTFWVSSPSSSQREESDNSLFFGGAQKTGEKCSPHGTSETLVSARIVVLQGDLQLDRLGELSLLGLARVLEHLGDGLVERFSRNFTHFSKICIIF